MPVLYEIDNEIGRIHTRCVGNVTLEEVVGHFHTLIEDPACPERLDVLLDLATVTSLPEPHQLRVVSNTIGQVRDRVRFEACAIVTKRTVLYGLMRMFEVFAESRFATTRVFKGEVEAVEWLELQRTARVRS